MSLGKKTPEESPQENCSPENYPAEKCPPGKLPPGKPSPPTNIVSLDFCCF